MVWKAINAENPVVPKRPDGNAGYGTLGRPIKLTSNFLTVDFKKNDVKIYHYDVTVLELSASEAEAAGAVAATPAAGASAQIPGLAAEGAAEGGAKKGRRRRNRGKGKAEAPGTEEESAAAGDVVPSTSEGITNQTGTSSKYRIPKTKLRKIFQKFLEDNQGVFRHNPIGFDGEKNCYSSCNIPQLSTKFSTTVNFDDNGREKKYKVSIVRVGGELLLRDLLRSVSGGLQQRLNLSDVFQALEVMFNSGRGMKYDLIGRNKFFSPTNEFDQSYGIGEGGEGRVGFYASFRAIQGGWKDAGKLALNIDIAHAGFYKHMPLLGFLDENGCFDREDLRRGLSDRARWNIKNLIVKQMIKVQTTYMKAYSRKFTAKDVGPETSFHKFEMDNQKITVKDYFKKKYNKDLQYPNLFCLKVGAQGKNLIPMELLEIVPGQKIKGKLTDTQTAAFIKKTAVKPFERLKQIDNIVRANDFNRDPILSGLGLQISLQPVRVDGRVLPAPRVVMRNRSGEDEICPREGVWDTRNHQYKNPGSLEKWAIINFAYMREDEIWNFASSLTRAARSKGMRATEALEVVDCTRNFDYNIIQKIMKRLKDTHGTLSIIVCIVDVKAGLYNTIKAVGDREMKIPTQCVKKRNASICNPATVSNILHKVNDKLSGTNFSSHFNRDLPAFKQLFSVPVMVMGADVNHPAPSPTDKSSPSLVAVVGSYDRNASKYGLEVRHQTHRTEVIKDICEITKNLLMNFYTKAKCKPLAIIMYRDGVSESQFTQVLSHELLGMREACSQLQNDYKPSITFFCVQKRHHTRLFVQNPKDAVRGNIPPGTIVDNTITHPTESDFYLCSHQGIQGTSKPSHYHCLWDDADLSMDLRQLLTYSLCHNYSRCSRSVSIPTPAYYAHLAAFRAKVHLDGIILKGGGDRPVPATTDKPDPKYEDFLRRATRVVSYVPQNNPDDLEFKGDSHFFV